MNIREIYDAYFEAFEVAFDEDEWEPVGRFFTEDAVYEAPRGGWVQGRGEILSQFKNSLDQFDRRFPVKRQIAIAEDQVELGDGYLKVPGNIHYKMPGAPELVFYMEEEVWFRDGRIERLVDTIPAAEAEKMAAYLAEHLG